MRSNRFASRTRLFRAGLLTLPGLFLSAPLVGCGGNPNQETGDVVKPDEAEAARQKEMADFYKTNPLSKQKPK